MRSLKVLSAGSTLYGMKPAAEAFTRETGIAVKVATDHGHNIHKFALEGTTDADVVLVPSDWSRELVATGRADKDALVDIGATTLTSRQETLTLTERKFRAGFVAPADYAQAQATVKEARANLDRRRRLVVACGDRTPAAPQR